MSGKISDEEFLRFLRDYLIRIREHLEFRRYVPLFSYLYEKLITKEFDQDDLEKLLWVSRRIRSPLYPELIETVEKFFRKKSAEKYEIFEKEIAKALETKGKINLLFFAWCGGLKPSSIEYTNGKWNA